MAYEVSGNIVAELSKRGSFGGFSEDRMQSLLEGMWNKVKCDLKDSQKVAGQLEDYSDSKVIQSVFNGSTFKYNFGGGGFHMLPQSYKFSHSLCLNTFPQFWFIGNKIDYILPFRYINGDDEVSHFII